MKLRLLPLSILLVASMAACKKDYPSATVGVNPDAPKAKDSILKTDNRWNWGGTAPMSFKVDGNMVIADQSGSSFSSWQQGGGMYVTQMTGKSVSASISKDITMQIQIPGLFRDMLAGQEYVIPVDENTSAHLLGTSENPDVPIAFRMVSGYGGNLRLRITNKTATEIEGKFYGVLRRMPGQQTTSQADWMKIEEGYFKYAL